MAVRPIDAVQVLHDINLHHKPTPVSEFESGFNDGLNQAMWEITHAPTLTPPKDSTPVQHGRWVKPVPGDGENYCSVCHAVQPWFYGYGYYDSDYCPNCGACMDAKEELKDGKDD